MFLFLKIKLKTPIVNRACKISKDVCEIDTRMQ